MLFIADRRDRYVPWLVPSYLDHIHMHSRPDRCPDTDIFLGTDKTIRNDPEGDVPGCLRLTTKSALPGNISRVLA